MYMVLTINDSACGSVSALSDAINYSRFEAFSLTMNLGLCGVPLEIYIVILKVCVN